MPADIIFNAADEAPTRYRMTEAYREVRIALRKAAMQNKRYYDIWVRPNSYRIGDWVYYFNPQKFAGKQDKWKRKYSGPLLVVDVPSSVTVRIQRRKAAKPFTVHVDKVKPDVLDYMPKSWVMDESAVSESERPVVEQPNEFESSAERLEGPTKQGPTEQRSLEPEISAEFDISSDTELKTPLRDTHGRLKSNITMR